MKNIVFNRKPIVSILIVMLVMCALPSISYGASDDISVVASTDSPLTEATLDESVVTLTLSGGAYERSGFTIRDAVEVSGIDGVTVGTFGIDRESDTEITVELEFDGNMDTDATLTFTVGADALAEYSGSPLTAQIPVTAVTESVVASTDSPLTEATLDESVVTLTLSGGAYERSGFTIRDAVEVSGIDGVTVGTFGIDRESDTEITVELEFGGNIDTDATLTFTVGADALVGYNGPVLTAQIPVSATRSVIASTSAPLTEATLDESVVTLTLSGGAYEQAGSDIRGAVAVSGIDGVTFGVERVSDTEITVELEFNGDIDTDATLTFTVGADALAGYNGPVLTAQIPVSATRSVIASTSAPLTEATLDESVVTLTLSGGAYEQAGSDIRGAVAVSGIDGVTFGVERASDTEVTVELEFDGNMDTDATLTFTVGADALAEYSGSPLTAQIPVTAVTESVVASTASPLTEATLDESVVTLTLSGGAYERSGFTIRDAVEVSGIDGVTVGTFGIDRESDTEITVELEFDGNIDTDATLTFTVGADALVGYNGPVLTAQIPVSATRSVIASTSAPLTEATLDESVVTLTLSGGAYEQAGSDIRGAVAVSGIDGVTFGVERVSDTEITVELEFNGDIDTDATLTFTVGADALAGYNGPVLTAQIPVSATRSVIASTSAPLTEATLDESVVTLTLSGGAYEQAGSDIRGAVAVSGIDGVTFGVERASDTEVTVELEFNGDIDTDATLTFTVGADALAGYNGPVLTAQIPVSATRSVIASTSAPLTEATLDESVVTLTLSGGAYEQAGSDIRGAVAVSGIDGVTFGVERVSDTEITVELEFNGTDFDTDAALTFTVGADALAGYNGSPLTTQIPVAAIAEAVVASTASPLTEATLDESVVTLTLSGGAYEQAGSDIRGAVAVSGIDGVTFGVERVSDTEITVELEFNGTDFDTDAALTFTVGADALAGYNGSPLTTQIPVAAIAEAVVASTASPLTEATLDESVVTLTLSGRTYARIGDIRDAVEVAGIEGVTVETFNVERASDTEVTVELEFNGDIDTDATLTFTVGADALAGYNGPVLTAQIPVSATRSVIASTSAPLTEATLDESVVTLTLSGGAYARSWDIRDAVEVSGIEGVTVETFNVERVSDTVVTVELEFDGNIDTDANLTFTVGADAIVGYNGPSLTAQIPVTATTEAEGPVTEDEEPDGSQPPEQPEQPEEPGNEGVTPTLSISTDSSLTEETLHESVVTLTLSGGAYDNNWNYISRSVTVSGIAGVTMSRFDIERISDTEITVELEFDGNIDTDATITFTVGADAIAEYNGSPLTAQILVTADTEVADDTGVTPPVTGDSGAQQPEQPEQPDEPGGEGGTPTLSISTDSPLTEATLDESVVTLTLSGGAYERSGFTIRDAVEVSGIDGVTVGTFGIDRESDTEITVELEFDGNIDTDTTLTFTVGADAIVGYNGPVLTAQIPVSATRSVIASTSAPLTEATLDESVVTLTLSGGTYARIGDIRDAVEVAGIEGVTVETFNVERASDTEVTVELEFNGDIDTDATLTFTVGADALAGYNGPVLTAQIPVSATRSVIASTSAPLTEATLDESVVTLSLSGGAYEQAGSDIRGAVAVSGIDGVTFGVERVSDTEITVELEFNGTDFDTDATLTFTVGADALAGYNGSPLTTQIPVAAIAEAVVASTASPLTEATLNESVVTLTLSGGAYARSWEISDAVEVSGIEGVTVGTFGIERISDTEITVELEFDGNIDTDATLTFTVGADAIVGYNGPALTTTQIPVTAITESVAAFTVSPLTKATLHGSEVTLILSGGTWSIWDIRNAVKVSGIEGVTVGISDVEHVSDTEITIELEFDGSVDGNIDTDVTLTFTVGADAIAGYNGPALTATPAVLTASVVASTASPLTEATLHESVVTLTLSDGSYEQSVSDIRDALMVSGMDGVTFDVERVSDTEITIELEFDGNIDGDVDTDATLTFTVGATRDIGAMLTFTVGANAIADYNGPTLAAQTPVTMNVPDTTTTGYGLSVAFSSYGILLAAASEDNTVRLWDVETNANIATLEGHEGRINAVAFSPDGTLLAAAGGNGTLRVWDIESGQKKAALKGHEWVASVAFSPDGTLLAASGGDVTVRLWDVETNANIATLEGHTEFVDAVAFSPDGTLLASGSWDNTIKLWDMETNTNIATLEGHTNGVVSIAFSPNGTRLASASVDNTVKLWDVETNTNIATLEGHTDRVWSVTFSPDGTLLASASADNTVKLWDVETNTNIATLEGHTNGVVSVAFSPNGTLLASASADNTVKLWDVVKWWTGDQPRPQTLIKVSGDDQEGMSGETLPNSLIVEVRDKDNNPLPGVGVTFTVTSGYGKLSEQSTIEYATTDANGQAEVTLTLGPFAGTNTVEVSLGLRTLAMFNAVGVGMPTLRSMEGDYRTWRLPDDAIMRLGKGALGRGDRVVAFSPDSTRLAVASAIGIWLYDVATGTEVALLGGHTGGVTSVAFSPDGTMLASGSQDETVKLWVVATHTNIATLRGHTDGVWSVAFSPDGKMLASGAGNPGRYFPADNTIKLWDVETNTNIATLEGHEGRVASVAFSPDGKILASGSEDETVKLWDVETNTNIATLEGHTDGVYSVAFSPDGKILASGGGTFDETVKLWDVETNTNTATLEGHTDGASSVAFSPDGKILASGVGDAFFPEFFLESSDNRVKLWDVASGEPIASLGGHTGEVWSVAFSPDGTMLASVGGTFDNRVKLWDVASGEPITSLEGHVDVVSSVAFLPDGTRLAARSGYSAVAFSSDGTRLATGSDNGILLWDVDSGDQITTLGGHTLSPDGSRLAAVSGDGKILVWDVDSGDQITTLEGHAEEAEGLGGAISVLVFSPDGTRLASGSGLFGDYTILLWDVDTGERIATLEGHTGGPWGAISVLAFSPDGTRLASASFDTESFDGTMLLLWDVESGERIATLVEGRRLGGAWGAISALTFSPDGTRLAAGSGNTILLWDMETRESIATLEGYEDYWVNSVSFSPDGAILASGSGNTILLWDMETKEIIATLKGHADWVNSVSFAPNGATLASGAGDGTILLWDVAEWTNSGTAVAANKLIGLPNELQLQQNAPNPFNSQTVISYFLPEPGPVRLELFSVIGQRVAVLRQGPQQAGYHRLHWNARDSAGHPLASGIYLYRLVTEEGILTRKLTLLR